MTTYSVTPLITLSMDRDKSLLVYGNGFGETVRSLSTCWLVRGKAGTLLVDSGVDSLLPVPAGVPQPGHRRSSLAELLAENRVAPESVSAIILTHLHWEQCGNLSLFPEAAIYVQKRELDYATAPFPYHWHEYDALTAGGSPPWLPHQNLLQTVDGDFEPLPGITAHLLPGHTPGMQNVAVQTDDGMVLIAGHNVPLAVNWEGTGKQRPIPSGVHLRLSEYYASLKKMENLGYRILPNQ